MRIVSLLPAATEIVCALGLRDQLVGRSHECDFPADVTALPVLTRARVDSSLPGAELDAQVRRVVEQRLPLYLLDEARLAALRPDVVVTQAACEVCAIAYEQVVTSLRRTALAATVVSLQPSLLRDVLADVVTVASACGIRDRGEKVARALQGRLDGVDAARPPGPYPRVAVIEWLAPPMLAGHWVPDAVTAAGGRPVGPAPGVASPYATWDEIRALRPEAVVVAACGFDLARTTAEAAPLRETLLGLAPRVLLMDGNAYLNRPGPRIVEAIESMAAWLRGGAVDTSRATLWETPPLR